MPKTKQAPTAAAPATDDETEQQTTQMKKKGRPPAAQANGQAGNPTKAKKTKNTSKRSIATPTPDGTMTASQITRKKR